MEEFTNLLLLLIMFIVGIIAICLDSIHYYLRKIYLLKKEEIELLKTNQP